MAPKKAADKAAPSTNGHNGRAFQAGFDPIATARLHRVLDQITETVRNQATTRSAAFQRFTDPRRSINDECGYPSTDEIAPIGNSGLYRELYDRNELAARVVQLWPKEAFRKQPKVYDREAVDGKDSPFTAAWKNLSRNVKPERSWYKTEEGSLLWQYVERWITLARIGHFGVLLLGVDDGKNLDEPVDGVSTLFAVNARDPVTNEIVTNEEGKPVFVLRERLADGRHWPSDPKPMPPVPERVDYKTKEVISNSSPWTAKDIEAEQAWIANRQRIVLNRSIVENAKRRGGEVTPFGGAGRQQPQRPGAPAPGVQPAQRGGQPQQQEGQGTASPRRPDKVASFGGAQGTDVQYDRMYESNNPQAVPPSDFDKGRLVGRQGLVPITAKDVVSAAIPPSNFDMMNPLAGAQTRGTDAQYTGVTFQPPGASSQSQYVGVQLTPPEYGEGRTPDQSGRQLLYMRPFDETLAQIVQYEADIRNPRFGLPVMYRVTLNDPREQHSGVGLPLATVRVHWSRIVHGADTTSNACSSDIFAPPAMRKHLNRLLDSEKVYGASGESYWLACFAGIFFGTHPQLGPDPFIDQAAFKDQIETFFNGLQRYLVGPGLTAQDLSPSVADPTPHIDKIIEAICIGEGCPVPVFKGYEIGEQASENNDESWDDKVAKWQHGAVTPLFLVPLIDRLVAMGVLPQPQPDEPKHDAASEEQVSPEEIDPTGDDDRQPLEGADAEDQADEEEPTGNASPPFAADDSDASQDDEADEPEEDDQSLLDSAGQTIGDAKQSKEGNYTIEWPDLGALTDPERADLTLKVAQAMTAYIQGGCEALMPVKDFFVRLLGWDEEEVEAMIADVRAQHEADDTMTVPPMQGGFTKSAPEGTQEHDDQQAQADQLEAFKNGGGDAGGGDEGADGGAEEGGGGGSPFPPKGPPKKPAFA